MKNNFENIAREQARALFEQWRIEYEEKIRKDALERSRAVIVAQAAEQLAPFYQSSPSTRKTRGS